MYVKRLVVVLLVVAGVILALPSAAAAIPLPGGIPVLVVQGVEPWGYHDYLTQLISLGYAPHVTDWSGVGTTELLEDFRYMYIPSVQDASFYATYTARMSEVADWVTGGGRLLFSVCTQGPVFTLPGGATHVRVLDSNNLIVDASHPIVTGVLSDGIALTDADLVGNLCSHNYFTVLPLSEHTILRGSTPGHGPTLVEYDFGAGHIIGSGLTWEYYLHNGSLGGAGSFAKRAYDDLILYAFPKTMHTVRASAGPGGTIVPTGDSTVVEGSTLAFTITADPVYIIAALYVDGAPVRVTSRESMNYTFSNVTADHTIAASFVRPDVMAPVIELPDGVPQSAVGSPYDLHLVVTDDTSIADVGVFENGQRVGGSPVGGDIHVRLTLPDGRHELVIVAFDSAGNRTERAITLIVDTRPPDLTVDLPSSVSTPTLLITGSAVDAVSGLASLTINGEPVVPFLDGSFSEKLALMKGENTIDVEAVDNVGHVASQTFTVTYSTSSSAAPSSLYVVLTIGKAEMDVNGMPVAMDAAPFIKDGRTLLPIRALIEALGGTVEWNASTKTATVMLGSRTVVLTIGSKTALVGGKPVALDVAPMIVKGRTFLPLRAVAENVGLDLAWEPVSQTISFTYWP
jgi:hypothetical protein